MEGEHIYEDYIDSRGITHQIRIGFKHKQCDLYEKYKGKGDKKAMYYLHIPDTMYPSYHIDHQINMIELPIECEERAADRTVAMMSSYHTRKKRFSLGDFLFGDW